MAFIDEATLTDWIYNTSGVKAQNPTVALNLRALPFPSYCLQSLLQVISEDK